MIMGRVVYEWPENKALDSLLQLVSLPLPCKYVSHSPPTISFRQEWCEDMRNIADDGKRQVK